MSVGLRLLYRDWRGGDIGILLVALALAVAIVTGVGLFSERLGSAIVARSGDMLGADLVLQSPRPVGDELLAPARALGLRSAYSLSFATMAARGEHLQISAVTAVDGHFPLRGAIRLEGDPGAAPRRTSGGPPRGQLWAERRLLDALGVEPGGLVDVGDASFTLAAVLVDAPGGMAGGLGLGPRLIMHVDDLPATGVVQPGSRVRYRYGFAGDAAAITAYRDRIGPLLLPEQRLRTPNEDRPGLAQAIDRAQSYLLLGGSLGVALAGAAIAIAARRYTERHIQGVAVLKTLGASARTITVIYAQKFLALATVAILLGFALGWLIQAAIVSVLTALAGADLGVAGWHPYALGAATGLVCLFAFALPPVWALRGVSPLAALRRDVQVERLGPWLSWSLGLAGLFGLMLWYSRSLWLAGAVFAGLLSTVLLVAVCGVALIRSTRLVGAHAGNRWLLATSSLRRRGMENALQIVVFAITIMLLLVLLVTRTSLIAEWQRELPEDAPNHFLINLLPADVPRLEGWLDRHGLGHGGIFPVVRGRLTHVDGVALEQLARSADTAAPDLDRELSLTSAARPPADNPLRAGAWWPPDSDARQVSIEAQLAQSLGVGVGSVLRFQIGSERFEVAVSSIRGVNWENMRPNFYMIFPPRLLQRYPMTYMTSFYLPPQRKGLLSELVRLLPAVTLIEIDAIIAQIRAVIDQVSLAIEAILWVVVACGGLVLLATVQAGLDERFRESSILRTLGAPSRLVLGALLIEFLLLGAMAGLLAALGAEATTWVLQTQLFHMAWRPHIWLWVLGPSLGAVLIAAIGTLACRRVVATPPVQVLRSLH